MNPAMDSATCLNMLFINVQMTDFCSFCLLKKKIMMYKNELTGLLCFYYYVQNELRVVMSRNCLRRHLVYTKLNGVNCRVDQTRGRVHHSSVYINAVTDYRGRNLRSIPFSVDRHSRTMCCNRLNRLNVCCLFVCVEYVDKKVNK